MCWRRPSSRIWPEAQFAAGPPVENGFYYDIELPHRISPEDFARIEEEMKKEIKANQSFERVTVTRAEALSLAEAGAWPRFRSARCRACSRSTSLNDIPEGEEISLFKNGDFLDLCAGPHVMRTGEYRRFKLTRVASAYYKGDEKNPQLQRIYGTAFKNRTELDEHLEQLEEAKKRDHRKLGQELRAVPHRRGRRPGADPLDCRTARSSARSCRTSSASSCAGRATSQVFTPHIGKLDLYRTRGHFPYYADSQFPPHRRTRADTRSKLSRRRASRAAASSTQPRLRDRGENRRLPAQADELPAPHQDLRGEPRTATATCPCGWPSSAPSTAGSSPANSAA